jgi:hypothetical protein
VSTAGARRRRAVLADARDAGERFLRIDTSGSIDQVTLDQFAAELNALVQDTKPPRHGDLCDAAVQEGR